MTNETPDSKPRRHKLSRFLCQEMLYDYVMDKLDPHRRESVRESLATDELTREALDNLREGLSYAHKLRGVTPSRPLVEKLLAAETSSRKLTRKLSFRELPSGIRVAVEALAVSATVALVVAFLPWDHLRRVLFRDVYQSVEIARVENLRKGEVPNTVEETSAPSQADATAGAGDSVNRGAGAGTGSSSASGAKVATAPGQAASQPGTAPAEPAGAPNAQSDPVNGTAAMAESKADTLVDQRKGGQLKGFVYRSFLKITDVDGATPKIVDAIRSLGGIKAGEVELGWRRGRNSYFHFSLPDNQYDSVVKSLQTFGVVRIYREPHRRVMPEGQIRFILWVEPLEE